LSDRDIQLSPPKDASDNLGLDLRPGATHYRAYVGPPVDYDLVAAMSLGLLTTLGLRQQHQVLDIGCGSLRVGRLLIPYLNPGGYTGLEPNEWLVNDGIANEIGEDQIRIKQPTFVFAESAAGLIAEGRRYDFMLAQSIFSHTGPDLLDRWLAEAAQLLTASGALVATFIPGDADTDRRGWIYPDCVAFQSATIQAFGSRHGLDFVPLDWRHPRQTWALLAKPGFDAEWYRDRPLSWTTCFDRINQAKQTAA
jgi:cyclopropane fatty-acyl-phospholipid synthase-like methyltransferase